MIALNPPCHPFARLWQPGAVPATPGTTSSSVVHQLLMLVLWMAAITLPGYGVAAQVANNQHTAVAANSSIVQYQPGIPLSARAKLPDTALMEFPNGRRISLGQLRAIDAASLKARSSRADHLPLAFRLKPAATGTPVRNADDLAAALKRPDTDTLQLPNGQVLTVGMLRYLKPKIEKRTGRKLSVSPQRPNLTGPALKVSAQSDWKSILKKPDNTLLEAPDGSRSTVGDVKKVLADAANKRRALQPNVSPGKQVVPVLTAPVTR